MADSKQVSPSIPISPSLSLETDRSIPEANPQPVNKRVLYLSLQAVFNAIVIGVVARLLVAFIDLITNISYYGKFSFVPSTPEHNQLGLLVIIVPVIGGLIVGVMARFGSPAIRGHGIPEAMEQVLLNESKIKPVITFLKPVSAAISIGTGGPFGSEGPIIATGGAFGSFTGQIMKISPNERKIMLSAGACAGMAAIFGAPLSAVLLAIELLLFEFSPRSIIPVALACTTGAAMHLALFGAEPVFAMPAIPEPTSMAMLTYVVLGAVVGVASALVSKSIYLIEDLFEKLPVHWMWWPAIGAIAVGVVGYFAPRTLGVGYVNISEILSGTPALGFLFSLCFLKFISWSVSLGSGTSGGTLAPLLTIGGALGSLLGIVALQIFPGCEINLSAAALIGMVAMFAGASRALLTAIVFALETTMQPHGLLPVLGAGTAAYFVSFFLMKGSIMTEKIQRRGVFTPDSYEPDILMRVQVREVISESSSLLSLENTVKEIREWAKLQIPENLSHAYVVIDPEGKLAGLVKRSAIFDKKYPDETPLGNLLERTAPYVLPSHPLSFAADLIDRFQTDVLPVIEAKGNKKVLGTISHKEIFKAYGKRRHEDTIHAQAISLKETSVSIIERGRQLFKGE